ncbi:DUF4352 domain-containing protein [Cellulomonas composti]|uniref:DUF4352 domain-containing protein n=1 Tax=Cellulomonas composti TaxID=266130 RepID=A0A511JA16_9CELL|nr:DUF4352 domain-containing protein [Cellulomonas composti]GEL94824.1 hypothetical protein CCO02nite_14820 [Cellulomonas composti]
MSTTDPSGQPLPPPAAAPEPKRSWFARHKILTAIGVVAVVAIAVNVAQGGGDAADDAAPGATTSAPAQDPTEAPADDATEPADDATEDAPKEPEEQPAGDSAGIGTPVRDGKFEFTVTAVETGVPSVGDDILSLDAQGQFVLVHVTVTNIGDEAQYFDGSSQELVDTEGRTHSASTEAAIYLDDANSILDQINPGVSVEGTVVFDIPADATPATLVLHDSAFSGGVEVAVS